MNPVIKNAKVVESNTEIATNLLNTQILKMIYYNTHFYVVTRINKKN